MQSPMQDRLKYANSEGKLLMSSWYNLKKKVYILKHSFRKCYYLLEIVYSGISSIPVYFLDFFNNLNSFTSWLLPEAANSVFAFDFRGDAPQHAQPSQDESSSSRVCQEQPELGVGPAGAKQSTFKNSATISKSVQCLLHIAVVHFSFFYLNLPD